MKWYNQKRSSLSFEDKLVQRVLDLERHLKQAFPEHATTISAMPVEKIKAWLLRMLERADSYKEEEVYFKVDTGYHSTRSENLDSIQAHGLLGFAERKAHQISCNNNGQSFGDGIYTVNSKPYWDTYRYGDTVLLVLRLRGKQACVPDAHESHDTVVKEEVVVLRSSCQCVPLISCSISFPKEQRRRFLRKMRRGMAGLNKHFQAELTLRLVQPRTNQLIRVKVTDLEELDKIECEIQVE